MKRPHSKGDRNAVARQKKILKEIGTDIPVYRKKHALDCGNPQCSLCHGDKYPERLDTTQEIQAEIKMKEEIREENL